MLGYGDAVTEMSDDQRSEDTWPSDRARPDPEDGYPPMSSSVWQSCRTVVRAWGRGFSTWRSAPIALTAVTLAVGALGGALLLWRWTQLPFIIFGLAPMVGGYIRFCARVSMKQSYGVETFMSALSEMDRWTGVLVISTLHLTLSLLPLCVGIAVGNMSPPNVRWIGWAIGGVFSSPFVLWMLAQLMYVPIVAVDADPADSLSTVFERAGALVTHDRTAAFLTMFTVGAALGLAAISSVYALSLAVPLSVLVVLEARDLTR